MCLEWPRQVKSCLEQVPIRSLTIHAAQGVRSSEPNIYICMNNQANYEARIMAPSQPGRSQSSRAESGVENVGHRPGKIYDVAAEYLLSCPESSAWVIEDEPMQVKKLGNYVKNALDAGKRYARQELYTSGATPVTPTPAYDWWDIADVQNMFKTSERAKQEHRHTSFTQIEQDEMSPVEEAGSVHAALTNPPIIAMSETATTVTADHEQAVGAEVLGQRRTSLGRSVSELKRATIPLMQQLADRLGGKAGEPETETMRTAKAFQWLYKAVPTSAGSKMCCQIALGNKTGKAITTVICALLDMGEEPGEITSFLMNYLCKDMMP